MFAMTLKKLLGRAVLALGLALSANAAFADVILNVNVNSASFGGSGYLDFEYIGGIGAPVSTVNMSNLTGFDLSKFVLDGSVVAQPGGLVFTNTPGLNSALYETVFDHAFSFTLTFAGDALDAMKSTFSIQAFNSDFSGGAGNLIDPMLLTLDWSLAPSGVAGVTPTAFDPSVSAVPAASVPEPSSLLMAALGLMLLAFIRRQRA